MLNRQQAAFSNRLGILLLVVGVAAAAASAMVPGLRQIGWLPFGIVLLALVAYGATVAIYRLTPEPFEESDEIRALRKLRECIAEHLGSQQHGEAARHVLADALRRLDGEMIPAVGGLVRRHALLQRDLDRFQTGELLAPSAERMDQLERLCERQQRAIESVGQQVADAYASLIMLTQQTDDEARLAADTQRWSSDLFEAQNNLAELLDEGAAFDRALEQWSKQRKSA